MLQYRKSYAVADISDAAATVVETFEAPVAGKLNTEACYITWIEATGTQATTQGVVSISVGGTVVATMTANISDAVGETQAFVPDGTVSTSANPWIEFDAGDDILVSITVQAVDAGGTIIGEGPVFLAIEWGF